MKKQAKQKGVHKVTADGPSRKELMEEAKAKKIKYFRILNSEELSQVLATEDEKAREKIIEKAKKRWMDCDFFKNKAKKAPKTEKKG
jgi:Mg/Co/Ni transporter MgtE